MTVNRKPTGTAASIPAGLAWGAMAETAVTLAGTLAATALINREILKWDNSGYAILIILLLSSWIGAMVASGKIKRRRAVVCIASGLIYFLLLLMTAALFFGGRYSGVGETALLIFSGSILGIFSQYTNKNRRKRRKMR